ncbi:unnamed protein product [Brugia timori]|uniref:Transposase n=1 Tax=Brugia timori TaxID=42155 RepID=A0A0R3QG28_9BILA|nr:unnamed protein product [Brugia timori]
MKGFGVDVFPSKKQTTVNTDNTTLDYIERVNAVADACIQGCQTVSKLVVSNNGTKYTLDSVSDKLKKKRSKVPQWSSIRDTPIVFTRAKHV